MTAPRDERGHPRRPSILRSALGTYTAQLIAAVLQLVNVLVIARVLGAGGRGEIAFLSTIAYLTAQIAALGVHQAAANLAARYPALRPGLATNSIGFALVLGGAAAGLVHVLVLAVPAVGGGADSGLRTFALLVIPILILEAYLTLFVRADYAFRVANAAAILVPITTASVNGGLAIAGSLTVGRAFGAWVAGQALGVLLLIYYIHTRLAGFGRPDLALAVRSLTFGVKAHTGRVMLLGNYKLDQWLVGAIAGKRELGLYSIAVTWAETLFYLPTAIAAVQRPDLVRASPREAAVRAGQALRATLLATAPVGVILVLAAPVLCVTVFGEEFRGSVSDLRVLVPGALGILVLKLLGNLFVAQGRPLLETGAIGLSFAVTLALNALLVPSLGGLGAAIASTAAYSVGGAAVVFFFARTFPARASELIPHGGELRWFWREVRELRRRQTPPPAGEGKFTG